MTLPLIRIIRGVEFETNTHVPEKVLAGLIKGSLRIQWVGFNQRPEDPEYL